MPSQAMRSQGLQSHTLANELVRAREQTDYLFRLISPEALYSRPISERHRLIFYLGHFDAFDWNLLARRSMNAPSFHPEFDKLFERGIDPAPGQAPVDSPADWPSQAEVQRYRARTRAWIDDHLEDLDPWVLQMAIEHRHMHAETLAYLLHGLPYDRKLDPSDGRRIIAQVRFCNSNSKTLKPVLQRWETTVPGLDGTTSIARTRCLYRHSASRSSKSRTAITWSLCRRAGPSPISGRVKMTPGSIAVCLRAIPLPLSWPVWVTWQQASAYAQWRNLTLPTEAQFQRAASLAQADAARDNFDYRRWDPIAVDADAEHRSVPVQMTGNGWEWTSDVFAPFAGFEAHRFLSRLFG